MLAPTERHALTGLTCGSRYEAHLTAYNRVGLGHPSGLLRFSTTGAGKNTTISFFGFSEDFLGYICSFVFALYCTVQYIPLEIHRHC